MDEAKKNKIDTWKHKGKLFIAGLTQVFFVASNVYMLAHLHYLGAIVTSFCLSAVWAYNVKRIAFGDTLDRFIYAAGACTGTVLGMFLTDLSKGWLA